MTGAKSKAAWKATAAVVTAIAILAVALSAAAPSAAPVRRPTTPLDVFETPDFQRILVDEDREGAEPVVSVAPGDVVWVAGMRSAADTDPANLWRKNGAGFEHLPHDIPGNSDATIGIAANGEQYWASMRGTVVDCSGHQQVHKMWLGYRSGEDSSWQSSGELLDLDRPWFVEHPQGSPGSSLAVIVTRWCDGVTEPTPHKSISVGERNGDAWTINRIFKDEEEGVIAGFPRFLDRQAPAADRIVVPFTTAPGAVSIPADTTGDVSYIISKDSGGLGQLWDEGAPRLGGGQALLIPWAAVDNAGGLYLVWIDDPPQAGAPHSIKFAYKADPTALGTPFGTPFTVWTVPPPPLPGADGSIWAISAVAGAQGRLAITWYAQRAVGQDWELHMSLVENAHASPEPHHVVVDPQVASPAITPHAIFRDLLTMEKLSTGNVVIAYDCQPLATNDCGNAGPPSHPKVAIQCEGSNVNQSSPGGQCPQAPPGGSGTGGAALAGALREVRRVVEGLLPPPRAHHASSLQ